MGGEWRRLSIDRYTSKKKRIRKKTKHQFQMRREGDLLALIEALKENVSALRFAVVFAIEGRNLECLVVFVTSHHGELRYDQYGR